jgi:hypothetical protein
MHIGILTHHWVYNFGANLQALATQTYLESLEHQVMILDYQPEGVKEALYSGVPDIQIEEHERFRRDFLNQSPRCDSAADLVSFCNEQEFDAILTGSDAVFRLARKPRREDQRFPNPFWLTWTTQLTSKSVVSTLAASSMGTPFFVLPLSVQRSIGQAIRNFDHISVRDKWTQWMFWWLSKGRGKASLCPDPVHILNDVFVLPDEFTLRPKEHHKQYILISIFRRLLSNKWIEEFVEIAHQHNLEVYSLPQPELEMNIPVDKIIKAPLSPFEWFAWIQNAAGYVGIRFHAIVSAITKNVPFVSFDTYQWRFIRMSSKTYDLCKQADMESFCLNEKLISRLTPLRAFQMLRSPRQSAARHYAVLAKSDFRKIVPQLLSANKDDGLV